MLGSECECFNSIVWRFAPRHLHCGLKIIETTTYLAAGVFNEDHSFILRIMSVLDIIIGRQSKSYADDNDKRRVTRQERRSLSETKEACKTRREQLLVENEFYKEVERPLWSWNRRLTQSTEATCPAD